MDDERIERALRQGPPDEPAYVPGVAGRVAAEGRATAADVPASTSRTDGSPELVALRADGVRLRRAGGANRRSLPIAIAAVLAIAVGGLFLWQTRISGPGATPAPSLDLYGRLHESGSIRIVVSNGAPQTVSVGGAYIGFDIDVAAAITGQLGLGPQHVSTVPSTNFTTTPWDLLLPGGTGASPPDTRASEPYAFWPVWIAAGPASTVTNLASLSSARVCVVAGSTGAAWLRGETGADSAPAPTGTTVVEAASDDECVAAVTDGSADAMVSAALLADELVSRGLHLVASTPVSTESWSAVVSGGADASSLLDAVNRAIADLRTSGRLADLSRSSFGGQDVTVRQP